MNKGWRISGERGRKMEEGDGGRIGRRGWARGSKDSRDSRKKGKSNYVTFTYV